MYDSEYIRVNFVVNNKVSMVEQLNHPEMVSIEFTKFDLPLKSIFNMEFCKNSQNHLYANHLQSYRTFDWDRCYFGCESTQFSEANKYTQFENVIMASI